LARRHDLQRFGFHGTSHQFVAERTAEFLGRDLRELRIISCHLGGGCSVCAVENARSVETSMGMTPLEGLVMATRSGDIDPGAIIHLIRTEEMTADTLDRLLNHQSGLAGLSGISGDLRDIERAAEEGNEDCRLALQVFCHRIRKYIGAYAAVMGGVDAIVFTAGIGQNSAVVRHSVAQRLDFLGAVFDERRNREAKVTRENPVAVLSSDDSPTSILAIVTDEAWAIARQCDALTRPAGSTGGNSPSPLRECETTIQAKTNSESSEAYEVEHTIPVAISARHVHLTQEMVELLFGQGHQLTPLKPLSQPGQFAAEEEVTLVGPKRSIERVRVLGPTRAKNQVEISRTDEFFLGVDAPIRASGDVENTPGMTLIGTDGRSETLHQGVICAWRHIHMTPQDADYFDVADGDVVDVEVGTTGVRSLTFGDVLVRVKSSYKLEMHIDTDEGNAAELSRNDVGELEVTDAEAKLRPAKS
jgi:acetate kinase